MIGTVAACLAAALSFGLAGLLAQVQGLQVSPSTPAVNQPVTVTVTGQNPCVALMLDLDTNPNAIVSTTHIPGLPFTVQHSWNSPGPRTVTAIGQGSCTGHASQKVLVTATGGLLTRLCTQVECGERPGMSFLTPRITATFGFNAPGGVLALAGRNFGAKPGSVKAVLKTWSGKPFERTLEVIEWTNTIVGVRWPSDISGVASQSSPLTLTNELGRRGWGSIRFSPELDTRTLGRAHVLSCGQDSNYDQCNSVRDDDDLYDNIGQPGEFQSPIHAMVGTHVNAWGAVGNDTGIDTYRIALMNGWSLESLHWAVSVDAGEGWAKKPAGFAKSAIWHPSIQWLVTPDDRVSYFAVVTMTGPVGVPHR